MWSPLRGHWERSFVPVWASLVKLDRNAYRTGKEILREAIDQVFARPEHRAIRLVIDVDPM